MLCTSSMLNMKFEINGSLIGSKFYGEFRRGVIDVVTLFENEIESFGGDWMEIYVDNAYPNYTLGEDCPFKKADIDKYIDITANSGYVPIAIPLFKKIMLVKLGVGSDLSYQNTVYQFSHELTHCLFFKRFGFSGDRLSVKEDEICTASSLMAIKELCNSDYSMYVEYTKNQAPSRYHGGVDFADEIHYSWGLLREAINLFEY